MGMHSTDTKPKQILPRILFLSAVVFWYELVLKFSTMKGDVFPDLLLIACGSLIAGSLLALLTSLFPDRRANRVLTGIALTALAVLFLVNYFVYYQFKIFYDINTITAGTSGVLSGFGDQIRLLVFSKDGLLRLALYFLPVLLYSALARFDAADRLSWPTASAACIALSASLGISLLSQYGIPVFRNTLFTEYSFQNTVCRNGLLQGLTMDLLHNEVDGENVDFHETAAVEAMRFERPAETVYEPNAMDIDFKKLASSASGTLKSLDEYCASLTPSLKNEYTGLFAGKNLIMITAEAFSAEVIDPVRTPTLYRMATQGIQFTDFCQPASAGTTGGEYEIVFGALPTSGGSSFKKMTKRLNYMTMGSQLDRLGYNGWAFHNNTYTFYDRHLTHNAIGYSNGFTGVGNGLEQYITDVWPESDLEMIEATLPMYIDKQPFNVYYMSVSGHNGYLPAQNAMAKKNWDRVEEGWSDTVHGYLASNLELEDALTSLIRTLEDKGIADDTVIVICADHFPYGLDYGASLGDMPYLEELYGTPVKDYLTRDHNRLIIWSGCLEEEDPIIVDDPVSSLDILPTLSNLFGTEFDSRLFAGRDVFSDTDPLVFNMNYEWKTDLGTYVNGKFTPVSDDTEIPDGYVERIRKIVQNKVQYCKGYQSEDYFRHVFGN